MELIYSMRRKPLKYEPPHFESISDPEVVRPICTISSCNIIAFSSPTELDDTDADTWGGHVYVCDLDTPWDSHKVTSTAYPVSALEWDNEGKQLLVATSVGDVFVFGQKDFLLNEWTCLYSSSFPGEQIIKAVFFHNGRRVVSLEKKTEALITDRIQVLRSTPTLKGFGGVACEGACVITSTGLIAALTPPAPAAASASAGTSGASAGSSSASAGTGPELPRAHTALDSLRAQRDHLTRASFAHKNGNLLVAAVCGGWRTGSRARACVRCALCQVGRAGAAAGTGAPAARPAHLHLVLQPLPTVYLPADATLPTSITWCLREDTDSLLVAEQTLTLWKLTERSYPVHKLLCKGAGNTTPGSGPKPADCFNTVVWQQTAAWPAEGGAGRHVCSARLPLAAPHAVLATPRALHLLSRDTHHYLCSRAVPEGAAPETPSATPAKKPKYSSGQPPGGSCAMVCCAELSVLGGVLVALDTHAQLHVYKLPQPWSDIPSPLAVQHATSLLEYAMVTGYDYLDVLMTLKPNIVEAVYERVTESFQRQPQAFQQYYYHSWLKLRIALCRLSGSSAAASSGSWLASAQALGAAWAAAGAALRPDERPDAAPLAALLDDHHADHDKALLTLEAKTEPCGDAGVVQALQALRRPLQRAADVACTVLAAAALQLHQPHQPHQLRHGYELWTDPSAMLLLRKILAVSRGVVGDVELSRLLARLSVSTVHKPDLLEECAALAGAGGPRVWEALPRTCVSAPHGRAWPLHLEYGVEPESLRYAPEPPAYAQGETTPTLTMDSIRYMYLGGCGGRGVARWRQCARCGARALPHAQPARHPLQRAHDNRHLPACRCGGKWTLFSNIKEKS